MFIPGQPNESLTVLHLELGPCVSLC